jgi:hypothetical protein
MAEPRSFPGPYSPAPTDVRAGSGLEPRAESGVSRLRGPVLALLASLPAGLGWLVLPPVLGGSAYAACEDLFAAVRS